ncbi:glycosyltransferase family 2 protein [Acinetobacter sp. ANC 4173]|uniref:glycosyltransferase family 2 protein n=1 Tax=Acinetobacter sp. ANC 4173 TaxID=2529837 RepID=UPI001040B005|nr:glycosyltransferase family 2 protein [Acinetobacter sp. ANC 4173]TCB80443.1 glycosyltransferase family 2 protein [Acinetobacter sp. ANC 4173]
MINQSENAPIISVGIPFYNAEKYLAFAIQSVLCQSYTNWELILVDDGSTDNSLKIAKEFACEDQRIRVFCDGENKKLPYRLNQLIKESKGKFIARMDADDIMHPSRLEMQLKYLLENNAFDLVSTGLVSIDDQNIVCGFRCVNSLTTEISKPFKFHIVHPTVMARKEWYLRNLYSLDYPRAEDFELWCRTYDQKDLKIAILPDLLLFYREFGNISIDNILKTCLDQHKITNYYKINNKIYNFIYFNFKYFFIYTVGFLGLGQNLSKRRNRNLSDHDAKAMQELLNLVVNRK